MSAMLKPKTYKKGEAIIRIGDPSSEIFFLSCGKVSVVIQRPDGRDYRLATFSPGMAFGEMGVIDQAPRSALILADTDVDCFVLQKATFDEMDRTQPQLKIRLLQNLALEFSRNLRQANREVLILSE